MSWIALTSAHLQRKLSAAEWTSITTTQLTDGVTGPEVVADEIAATVRMVVGFVSANRQNVVGPAGTIPDELEDQALSILRHKVFSRLPGLAKRFLDEGRVREYEDAMRILRDVAMGRFLVASPEVAGEEQAGGQTIAVVNPPPGRENTRQKWSGTL